MADPLRIEADYRRYKLDTPLSWGLRIVTPGDRGDVITYDDKETWGKRLDDVADVEFSGTGASTSRNRTYLVRYVAGAAALDRIITPDGRWGVLSVDIIERRRWMRVEVTAIRTNG